MEFKDVKSFNSFLEGNTVSEINSGCEGTCYLGKDGFVYKTFLTGFEFIDYDIDKIITTDDIKLEYIILPIELYTIKDRLVGIKTRYVKNNIFDYEKKEKFLGEINFEQMKEAYNEILIDIIILARKHIKVYDLPYNLLYDGNRFYAIDTCGYEKSDEDISSIMKHNIESLNNAVMDAINAQIKEDEECYTNSYTKYIKVLTKKQKKYFN